MKFGINIYGDKETVENLFVDRVKLKIAESIYSKVVEHLEEDIFNTIYFNKIKWAEDGTEGEYVFDLADLITK